MKLIELGTYLNSRWIRFISDPLFGEGWNPDDIVREIDADENFRIRILDLEDEIEEEYEEF